MMAMRKGIPMMAYQHPPGDPRPHEEKNDP
jgi:hypothetical protein